MFLSCDCGCFFQYELAADGDGREHEVKVGMLLGVFLPVVSSKNVLLLAVLVVGLGTCYMLHSVLGICLGYQECLHVHLLLERCEATWMGAMKTSSNEWLL